MQPSPPLAFTWGQTYNGVLWFCQSFLTPSLLPFIEALLLIKCLISSRCLLSGGPGLTHLSSYLVYPGNYANHNLQRVLPGADLGEMMFTTVLRSLRFHFSSGSFLPSFDFPPYFNMESPLPLLWFPSCQWCLIGLSSSAPFSLPAPGNLELPSVNNIVQ